MKQYWITFYGDEEKPIKINEREFQEIKKIINQVKFIAVKGETIAASLIKRITPIKEDLLGLPEPSPKPFDVRKYKRMQ